MTMIREGSSSSLSCSTTGFVNRPRPQNRIQQAMRPRRYARLPKPGTPRRDRWPLGISVIYPARIPVPTRPRKGKPRARRREGSQTLPGVTKYPGRPGGVHAPFRSGRWMKWDADDRCPRCGTPKVSAVEGTTADLGSSRRRYSMRKLLLAATLVSASRSCSDWRWCLRVPTPKRTTGTSASSSEHPEWTRCFRPDRTRSASTRTRSRRRPARTRSPSVTSSPTHRVAPSS